MERNLMAIRLRSEWQMLNRKNIIKLVCKYFLQVAVIDGVTSVSEWGSCSWNTRTVLDRIGKPSLHTARLHLAHGFAQICSNENMFHIY